MAGTLSLFTFEDKDGNEFGCYKTQNYREAKEYASRYKLRVIENVFEWSESNLVDDFTESEEECSCDDSTCEVCRRDNEGRE